ncbi:selenocysteine-specific translation elongation factor [Caloramator sp. CAR-1]|uniref:selenocysteine-specific translation elongation factor n=1 Tax=Caloramator sp. CAR-1 TaxID=3062777 RepID=UPI0026E32301|nr:selenocysteine-specific translation elongation factor [Caloramator sp. CAR-1]MDO6355364.1 selenocysteine-specific translation elongation factor [Caloramator sp. CAR-1]
MQHVIIGTAGHIDHGKTTLIKALTGRDTDTLKEEKERGISINLGFTYFDLPSGRRAGIVDVPGHEKFIKNMLAGVTGIDIVLLVIAADEGIMPQTREHLNILNLLDIKKGIVVVTKKDLVDEEWLKMVIEDIKTEISDTFLRDAPIIPVSSYTGEGLEKLALTIDELTKDMEDRDTFTDFRLPIDRVFSVSGFGTVVTGTLISGTIYEGDICSIYPKEITTKVRGLQVHEKSVKTAYAGQRVAINLANVKKEDIERGDVLSKPNSLQVSMMLDCRLNYLKDAPYPLENRDRIRIYHGTSELLGRVYILDKEVINPGETALIQIRLESPIAAKRGDKYVIRTYSPMITVGGGTILDPNPVKHKAFDEKVINELLLKEKGDPIEIIEQTIKNNSKDFIGINDIIKLSGKNYSNLDDILETLIRKEKIIKLNIGDEEVYLHKTYLEEIKKNIAQILADYHRINPLKFGITKEELKIKVFGKNIKQKIYDKILELLCDDTIKIENIYISLKDFNICFNQKQENIKQEILMRFEEAKYQPPKPEDLIKGFGRDERDAKMVFEALVDLGTLVKINEEIYLKAQDYERAKDMLIDFIKREGSITAAQYRDMLSTSRKYAVAILEYFDSIKLTKRIEDQRVLA